MQLHQLCPIFQLRRGDLRESLHVNGVLCFVLQQRNKKPFAFKIICLLDAVDRAVGRSPAARPVPAEGQVIHPASEYEAFEDVDRVFRRSVRQLDAVDGRNRFPPDIRAVIALGSAEKRMIAIRFKHRLKLLRQKLFIRIRHVQKRFQPYQQLTRGLRLRQAAIKDVAKINLIQTQNVIERVRYVKPAVFAVFKNRGIRGKNFFEFLVLAHVCDGALYISVYEKLTDLHSCSFSEFIRTARRGIAAPSHLWPARPAGRSFRRRSTPCSRAARFAAARCRSC